jgi:hypothetical protein
MLLHATWRSDQRIDPRDWHFRTPHGSGAGTLSSDGRSGEMLLRIKLDLGTAFTEVGRFTALGAAAFIELPNVSGSNSEQ